MVHAATPRKNAGIAMNAMRSGGTTKSSRPTIGMATSVPKVPGARGASPAPNPSAMKCAGCETRKRRSGLGEMVEAAAIDLHGLAVGSHQRHALAAADLPDARDRHAEHLVQVLDAVARVGRRREAELVVVAARDDR